MPDTPLAAIFDLDGTLIDSYEAHHRAWKAVCLAHSIDLTPAQFAWSFGRTNPSIIDRIWPDAGLPAPDEESRNAIADAKETDFRRELEQSFPTMLGAPGLLADLSRSGWRLAIGTSAPRGNLETALRYLPHADQFDATVCGDEVVHGKPDPEVFLLAAERLGIEPQRCVVIEDAGPGIDAARAAGMTSVGLVSTGRTPDELDHAHLVVRQLTELNSERLEALIQNR
ncbi:MAG: HAD family phosphatase [Phycisphaerales bacterium]|nr:HAD family phosphatase [Phycisphaerales bacterium]